MGKSIKGNIINWSRNITTVKKKIAKKEKSSTLAITGYLELKKKQLLVLEIEV